MALRIYDVDQDQHRDATQVDIDALELVANAYGQIRAHVARTHDDLMSRLTDLRQRAAVSRQVDGATDATQEG